MQHSITHNRTTFTAYLEWQTYEADNTHCLTIWTDEGLYADATTCLAPYNIKPTPGNILIKNYSESTGLATSLRNAKIIGETTRTHKIGPYQAEVIEAPLLQTTTTR